VRRYKTKIIAISGTSGGGKTTAVTELQKRTPNSITLSLEDGDYEKNSGITDLAQWEEDGWDVSQWNLQSLADDIEILLRSNYEYIFFDYPFGYMQKQISEYISLSVHIDTPLDVALVRRMLRDCKNKSTAEIMEQLEWYLGKRHLFTKSNDFQKEDAELIVDGCLSTDDICDIILEAASLCASDEGTSIDDFQHNMQQKLREDFIKNHKNTSEELAEALSRRDHKEALDLAYKLKSTAAIIQETKLAAAAEAIESLLTDGARPPSGHLKTLETELKASLEKLA